jgi:SAM-dependent methyltransferase
MESRVLKRTYIQVPTRQAPERTRTLKRAVLGIALTPAFWLLALRYRTPGLRLRARSAWLGLRLLCGRQRSASPTDIVPLLFRPMDSTRYFEFDFAWEAMGKLTPPYRYLDVSSPRLFPIMVALQKRQVRAELLNPDATDLVSTARLVRAFGLERRCSTQGCLIGAAGFDRASFDVITSISVVEHIPDDSEAVRKMWDFLKPGGRLILTLPVAAQPSERYINRNEYGLLQPDKQGYFFFYRLYDQRSLEERIFSVTGVPHRHAIYGEKSAGTLLRNMDRKMADPAYPHWREPYMMGKEFCYFNSLSDLPGDGVIALEFEKSE